MFNSNQVTMQIDGNEYILSLNRKGLEAIERYTKLSQRTKELKIISFEQEYVDEIGIDDDPFAESKLDKKEEELDKMMEILKRVLWICLWENHKLNIEQVRELLVKLIDENKFEELNTKIQTLIEGVNKNPEMNELKNLKALKAQK